MVVANNIFNRVREVDSSEDVAADGGMNLHLRKFGFGKFARFVQDVFGHRQLANIVKQSSSKKRLQFLAAEVEESAHLRRINLSSANVAMSCLVFCVDRNRQRLNRVHVNLRHLFDVLALTSFS